MAWLSPSVFIEKKRLRDDDHKDELTPRSDPYIVQGLEGSWTHKERECTVIG